MTSDNGNREAFVWVWLPSETKPIVAGRLEAVDGNTLFNVTAHSPTLFPLYISRDKLATV